MISFGRSDLVQVVLFLAFGVFAISCQEEGGGPATTDPEPGPAQRIIDDAIAAHGAGKLANGRLEFDFRDRHYVGDRDRGRFTYERIFTDSTGQDVRDIMTNEGFRRIVNGQEVNLSSEDSSAYSNSVNSVLYFVMLPLFLNDAAVQKEYLGEETIEQEVYSKVKVTFKADGGGKDHEDEYIYWFHKDRHTMDYMAYNYLTDGGGARFRKAYNIRTIEGIRFADYINYKPIVDSRNVEDFARMFTDGELEELSRIDSERITFRPTSK